MCRVAWSLINQNCSNVSGAGQLLVHKNCFFELKPEDLEQGLTCDLGQFHMPDMTPQQPMHPNTKGDTLGTAIVPVGAVGNQVK